VDIGRFEFRAAHLDHRQPSAWCLLLCVRVRHSGYVAKNLISLFPASLARFRSISSCRRALVYCAPFVFRQAFSFCAKNIIAISIFLFFQILDTNRFIWPRPTMTTTTSISRLSKQLRSRFLLLLLNCQFCCLTGVFLFSSQIPTDIPGNIRRENVSCTHNIPF
jgi:hypothetical protein